MADVLEQALHLRPQRAGLLGKTLRLASSQARPRRKSLNSFQTSLRAARTAISKAVVTSKRRRSSLGGSSSRRRRSSSSLEKRASPTATSGSQDVDVPQHLELDMLYPNYLRAAYVCDESAFEVLGRLGDEGNPVVLHMLGKKFLFAYYKDGYPLFDGLPERRKAQGWQEWHHEGDRCDGHDQHLLSVIRKKLDPGCSSLDPSMDAYFGACRFDNRFSQVCLQHTVFVTANADFYSRYIANAAAFHKLVEIGVNDRAHGYRARRDPVYAAWYVSSQGKHPDPRQQLFYSEVPRLCPRGCDRRPEYCPEDRLLRGAGVCHHPGVVPIAKVLVCDVWAYQRLSKLAEKLDDPVGRLVRAYAFRGSMWLCTSNPPPEGELEPGWRLWPFRDNDQSTEREAAGAYRNACLPCSACKIPPELVVFTTGDARFLDMLVNRPDEVLVPAGGRRLRLAWDVSRTEPAKAFTFLDDPVTTLPRNQIRRRFENWDLGLEEQDMWGLDIPCRSVVL